MAAVDALNPFRSTRSDVLWCAKNVLPFISWALYQINPFNANMPGAVDNELTLRWSDPWLSIKNLGSVLYVVLMTVLSALMLRYVELAPLAMLLYIICEAKDSDITEPIDANAGDAASSSAIPRRTLFYINGIATTRHWFELNLQRLAGQYGNQGYRVRGIFNESYGLVSDLFESIIQRNFRIQTAIVRQGAHAIRLELDMGREVLLVAHSQGGIIASLIVEALALHYSIRRNMPPGNPSPLRRLSVLTFASAARQFVNPHGNLRCIEHFLNEQDMVGWSTMRYATPNGDIEGDVFVSTEPRRGHLFNAFFSLQPADYRRMGGNAGPPSTLLPH